MRNENHEKPISVVERVSLVLETFNGSGPLTLAQITKRTGLPRSSAHRLLEQLTATGWLIRSEQTYEHGPKIYEAGQAAFQQNRLTHDAEPIMRRLAYTTGLTVHLGGLVGEDILFLAKVRGRNGDAASRIGARVPAHQTAIGKAILAHYPDDRLPTGRNGKLERATVHSIGTPDRLRDELRRTRDRGTAFDRQESADGVGCVAVSLGAPDHYYGNRAAISVCGRAEHMEMSKLIAPVRIAARDIWDRCVATHLEAAHSPGWHASAMHRTA